MQKTIGAHNTDRARKVPEVGRTGARFGPPGQWRLTDTAAEPELPAEAEDASPIGLTGARFGGAKRKRKTRPADVTAARAEPDAEVAEVNTAPVTAAMTAETAAETAAGPPAESAAGNAVEWWDAETPAEPEEHWAEEYSDWLARPESHALVRPYAWTGGRTRAVGDLAIEALVHTTARREQASWELRAITEICRTPRSVAEVAALLAVPLGVARVLIADLADTGAIQVHRVSRGAPDLAMMNRVLAGLRRL